MNDNVLKFLVSIIKINRSDLSEDAKQKLKQIVLDEVINGAKN